MAEMSENLRRLEIHSITKCTRDGEAYMVVLNEVAGRRILPVLTDQYAAQQIFHRWRGGSEGPVSVTSLPDVFFSAFHSFRIRMEEVRISAVEGGVTYCHLVFDQDGVHRVVRNCRASDGLVLAATFGCPIHIAEELLDMQSMRQTSEDSYSIPVNSVTTEALRNALEQAVKDENYELASKLRDELQRRS